MQLIFDETDNIIDYGDEGMPDWWIDPETDEEIQNVKKIGYN